MDTIPYISPFLLGLLTATGIGLIVGLEREHNQQTDEHNRLAGLRTFSLLCILGFVSAFIAREFAAWVLPVTVLALGVLVGVAYFQQARNGNIGLTTELALLLVFSLGVLVAYDHHLDAVAVAVVATVLLTLKEELHSFVGKLNEQELGAFVKFFVLALLLLPALPSEDFGPGGRLNYRDLGWIVVLVSSISFAGYLLLKFLRNDAGLLLTGAVGGLFSSTMIAWVFAARTREMPAMTQGLTAGIILASAIMPARVLFLTWVFNRPLTMVLLVPCSIMIAVCLVSAAWLWRLRGQKKQEKKQRGSADQELPLGNPLDLKNVLVFLGIYIGVTLFMYFSRQWFGDAGAYVTALISGLADADAITISTAKTTQEQVQFGAVLIVLAILSNTVFKLAVSLGRATPEARRYLLFSFGAVVAAGLAWLGAVTVFR